MTINERKFQNYFNQALESYKHAVEAKSFKNKFKFATESIEAFQKALELAHLIGKKDKIPYIMEYICLCQGLIAMEYLEEHNIPEALKYINLARESNKETLHNQETIVRELFFLEHLMHIAEQTQQWDSADNFAQLIFNTVKKLMDIAKSIQYLQKIKKVFIQAKDLKYTTETYEYLLKLVKKIPPNTIDNQTEIVAEIYDNSTRYWLLVLKKNKKANEYYEIAMKLYKELNLQEKIIELTKFVQENSKSK